MGWCAPSSLITVLMLAELRHVLDHRARIRGSTDRCAFSLSVEPMPRMRVAAHSAARGMTTVARGIYKPKREAGQRYCLLEASFGGHLDR